MHPGHFPSREGENERRPISCAHSSWIKRSTLLCRKTTWVHPVVSFPLIINITCVLQVFWYRVAAWCARRHQPFADCLLDHRGKIRVANHHGVIGPHISLDLQISTFLCLGELQYSGHTSIRLRARPLECIKSYVVGLGAQTFRQLSGSC